ncbi:MAG: mechanosensitive ion channel [Parvularculaceae bacterium]|nr:mechanosensitive ion channel [Parvularculaceae bacterium]
MEQIRLQAQHTLERVISFMPELLSAVVLAITGVVIARIVQLFLHRAIDSSKIGMATNRDALGPNNPSLGKSLGSAAFWLIILLFIPPVLGVLGLTETLAPLNSMTTTVTEYLPRIGAAALIIVIGFIIATVARRAVSSLLAAAPIDHAAERAELGDFVKGAEITRAAGLIVYVLILIPAFIAGLEALKIESISRPLTSMLQTMLDAIPHIISAVVVLFFFTLFARAARAFMISFLTGLGFDNFWRQLGIAIEHHEDEQAAAAAEPSGRLSPTIVVANIAMAAMLIIGAITAAQQLRIDPVSAALSQILSIGGQILLGSIVILAGIPVSRFVANTIKRTGDARSELVGTVVQWGILVLVTAIGVREMGLGEDIIFAGFVLLLGSASVAAALAFGIGGRGAAARMLDRLDQDRD